MRKRVVPEYVIDRMYEKMKRTYNQIYEEIPSENIINIINTNNNLTDNYKKIR